MGKSMKSVPADSGDPFAAMNARGKVEPSPEPLVVVDAGDPNGHPDHETPLAPSRYRPGADPEHVESLELFERLRDGLLIVPGAYQAAACVDERIAALRKLVEPPDQEAKP